MDLGAVTIRPVNIEIAIDAKSRAIRLSDRIRFGRWRRRTRLARSAYAVLDDVAAYLRKHPDIVQVEIQGHTDARGRAAQKLRLSQQRAEVVKQYLVKKGIDAKRLRVKGFGGTRPVASNRTRAGRARNSRIEFHILGERGRSGGEQDQRGANGGTVGRDHGRGILPATPPTLTPTRSSPAACSRCRDRRARSPSPRSGSGC